MRPIYNILESEHRIKRILIIIIFFFFIKGSLCAGVYYVSTEARDSSAGTLEDPWRFNYALEHSNAGDTIWIQSGNYGSMNLKFRNSGTKDLKIVLMGYHLIPGDIDIKQLPQNPEGYLSDSKVLNYPMIKGFDRSQGIGILMENIKHVVLKNIHVTDYKVAVNIFFSDSIELENIIVAYLGDLNINSGSGIKIHNSNHCIVKECFVYNAVLEGITIAANGISTKAMHNIIQNCSVWSDDDSTGYISATDYYYLIGGIGNCKADSNILIDCYAERVGNLQHLGHGYSLVAYQNDTSYGSAKYNRIEGSHAENITELFLLRGPEVEFNNFVDCTSSSQEKNYGGILRVDASKNNTFECIKTKNTGSWGAICFTRDTTVVKSYEYSSKRNRFINCIFIDANVGIGFMGYTSSDNPLYLEKFSADSNQIINCNFVNTIKDKHSKFVHCERNNFGNKITNSIIIGYNNFQTNKYKKKAKLYFDNCCIFNNRFSLKKMDNTILINCFEKDPLFYSIDSADFRLKESSPCVDTGTEVELFTDYAQHFRPSDFQYDIGAFEFQQASDSVMRTFIVRKTIENGLFMIESEKQIENYRLYNDEGQLLEFISIRQTNFRIDIRNFPKGIYLLTVIYEDNRPESIQLLYE